jgi:hypothetical protein
MRYSLEIPSMTAAEMLSIAKYLEDNNVAYKSQEYPTENEWSHDDIVKRLPTSHFAKMCGGECLNSKGMVSKKDAYDVLEHYMKIHKVREENGLIYIEGWIQQLIQEARSTITRKDLRVIVDKFFA